MDELEQRLDDIRAKSHTLDAHNADLQEINGMITSLLDDPVFASDSDQAHILQTLKQNFNSTQITDETRQGLLAHLKQFEEEGQDFYVNAPTPSGTQPDVAPLTSQSAGVDDEDPITKAIREKILFEQRKELQKYFPDLAAPAARDDEDDKKLRAFLSADANRAVVEEALKAAKPKLEELEIAGYKSVHQQFNDRFKPIAWNTPDPTGAQQPGVRYQRVNNDNGDEICTLKESVHRVDAVVRKDDGTFAKLNAHRVVDFPVTLDKASGYAHLSIAAMDVNGRKNKEIFFTAHYEEQADGPPKLKEISHPQPIKFNGPSDDAIGYVEHGGRVYSMPVTQGKLKKMMREVARDNGQNIDLSQTLEVTAQEREEFLAQQQARSTTTQSQNLNVNNPNIDPREQGGGVGTPPPQADLGAAQRQSQFDPNAAGSQQPGSGGAQGPQPFNPNIAAQGPQRSPVGTQPLQQSGPLNEAVRNVLDSDDSLENKRNFVIGTAKSLLEQVSTSEDILLDMNTITNTILANPKLRSEEKVDILGAHFANAINSSNKDASNNERFTNEDRQNFATIAETLTLESGLDTKDVVNTIKGFVDEVAGSEIKHAVENFVDPVEDPKTICLSGAEKQEILDHINTKKAEIDDVGRGTPAPHQPGPRVAAGQGPRQAPSMEDMVQALQNDVNAILNGSLPVANKQNEITTKLTDKALQSMDLNSGEILVALDTIGDTILDHPETPTKEKGDILRAHFASTVNSLYERLEDEDLIKFTTKTERNILDHDEFDPERKVELVKGLVDEVVASSRDIILKEEILESLLPPITTSTAINDEQKQGVLDHIRNGQRTVVDDFMRDVLAETRDTARELIEDATERLAGDEQLSLSAKEVVFEQMGVTVVTSSIASEEKEQATAAIVDGTLASAASGDHKAAMTGALIGGLNSGDNAEEVKVLTDIVREKASQASSHVDSPEMQQDPKTIADMAKRLVKDEKVGIETKVEWFEKTAKDLANDPATPAQRTELKEVCEVIMSEATPGDQVPMVRAVQKGITNSDAGETTKVELLTVVKDVTGIEDEELRRQSPEQRQSPLQPEGEELQAGESAASRAMENEGGRMPVSREELEEQVAKYRRTFSLDSVGSTHREMVLEEYKGKDSFEAKETFVDKVINGGWEDLLKEPINPKTFGKTEKDLLLAGFLKVEEDNLKKAKDVEQKVGVREQSSEKNTEFARSKAEAIDEIGETMKMLNAKKASLGGKEVEPKKVESHRGPGSQGRQI